MIGGYAHEGGRPLADAALACVCLGANVTIVAARTIGLRWVAARARRRIAKADEVAFVARRAQFGARSDASAGLAGVYLSTSVAVVARRSAQRGASSVVGGTCGDAARETVTRRSAAACGVAAHGVHAEPARTILRRRAGGAETKKRIV